MDYNLILKDIKPTPKEQEEINNISSKIINFLNDLLEKENIEANVRLVGSVAKGTYLQGKSDIDIFIAFSLDTDETYLKKVGLDLGYRCNDYFNGVASEHFASHPYLTCDIGGFEIDFVPCYAIKDGSQLKSAVDRTILHTEYINDNVNDCQREEILLLKRFMDMTGTYGSEVKTGGFAGYLCELLILKYGTFENTLKQASEWKYGHVIDLQDYGTSNLFKDPLIVVDPTDKNRNVGAALRLDKMGEFIQSARNYLNSDNKKDYFYPLVKNINKEDILNEFKSRGSDLIAIKFKIPDIPLDTLHPQIRKTTESLANKLNHEEFNVFQASYWSDEEDIAVILLELASSKLNNIKIQKGPKIFIKKACQNFVLKYGAENCYVLDDFYCVNVKREITTAQDYVKHVFTKEKIALIKVGKNLKENLIETHELISLESLADNDDFLIFLDEFLNPCQHISR